MEMKIAPEEQWVEFESRDDDNEEIREEHKEKSADEVEDIFIKELPPDDEPQTEAERVKKGKRVLTKAQIEGLKKGREKMKARRKQKLKDEMKEELKAEKEEPIESKAKKPTVLPPTLASLRKKLEEAEKKTKIKGFRKYDFC